MGRTARRPPRRAGPPPAAGTSRRAPAGHGVDAPAIVRSGSRPDPAWTGWPVAAADPVDRPLPAVAAPPAPGAARPSRGRRPGPPSVSAVARPIRTFRGSQTPARPAWVRLWAAWSGTANRTGTAIRTGTAPRPGTATGIGMATRTGTAISRDSAAMAAAAGRTSVMAPAARSVAGPGLARTR